MPQKHVMRVSPTIGLLIQNFKRNKYQARF